MPRNGVQQEAGGEIHPATLNALKLLLQTASRGGLGEQQQSPLGVNNSSYVSKRCLRRRRQRKSKKIAHLRNPLSRDLNVNIASPPTNSRGQLKNESYCRDRHLSPSRLNLRRKEPEWYGESGRTENVSHGHMYEAVTFNQRFSAPLPQSPPLDRELRLNDTGLNSSAPHLNEHVLKIQKSRSVKDRLGNFAIDEDNHLESNQHFYHQREESQGFDGFQRLVSPVDVRPRSSLPSHYEQLISDTSSRLVQEFGFDRNFSNEDDFESNRRWPPIRGSEARRVNIGPLSSSRSLSPERLLRLLNRCRESDYRFSHGSRSPNNNSIQGLDDRGGNQGMGFGSLVRNEILRNQLSRHNDGGGQDFDGSDRQGESAINDLSCGRLFRHDGYSNIHDRAFTSHRPPSPDFIDIAQNQDTTRELQCEDTHRNVRRFLNYGGNDGNIFPRSYGFFTPDEGARDEFNRRDDWPQSANNRAAHRDLPKRPPPVVVLSDKVLKSHHDAVVMAIVNSKEPEKMFTDEQTKQINDFIHEQMEDPSIRKPQLTNISVNRGTIYVKCANAYSVEWLTNQVAQLNLKPPQNLQFKVMEAHKFLNAREKLRNQKKATHRVKCTVPLRFTSSNIIKVLGYQNRKLDTSKWELISMTEGPENASFLFGIDQDSMNYLESNRYLLFFGTSMILFE